MPSTLVIVDMQPDFSSSSNPDTLIAVANEIILAKQKRDAIILVEYAGCERTYSGLNALIKGYPRKARTTKWEDDGSSEVVRVLAKHGFPMKNLRVCGVNTDCCVWETVVGLLQKLDKSQIEVVKKACNNMSGRFDWRRYYRHPNLRLV